MILLDLNLFGKDGFNMVRKIRQLLPHTKIYIMGMFKEEYHLRIAEFAGSVDYIPKEKLHEDLIKLSTISLKKEAAPDL